MVTGASARGKGDDQRILESGPLTTYLHAALSGRQRRRCERSARQFLEGSPDRIDVSVRNAREETLRKVRELQGWKGIIGLADRNSGRVKLITSGKIRRPFRRPSSRRIGYASRLRRAVASASQASTATRWRARNG